MRLEFRKVELIESTDTTNKYKLKCSLQEAIKLKQYIIKDDPLCVYDSNAHNGPWKFNCYTDDESTYCEFSYNNITERMYESHLTFIIPEYFENSLREGFYCKGRFEKAVDSLSYYVKDITHNYYYVMQEMGGGGDPEYSYLEILCDLAESLSDTFEVIFDNDNNSCEAMKQLLPLGIRCNIEIEVPKDEVEKLHLYNNKIKFNKRR